MRRTRLIAPLAVSLVVTLAAQARAQTAGEDIAIKAASLTPIALGLALAPVPIKWPAPTFASTTERRPPQAEPEDPSKASAAPDPSQIRRAVGGFVGGLVGLAAGSFIGGMTRTREGQFAIAFPTTGVVAGIVLGISFAGR